ncbi:helix-turn-helix domain-containing protein [Sutcliffiella horikoshii]|uniref:Helix-turn-helix domain-containing protein n=1 Tax=Sutcliffiella horikoshii TaxID=79883 RepID=A0AA95B5X3_9BACI|nr:helix-turn-helix transcriptional regulator [Sutcliffiella horikoshii]TYS58750.1 helix-turn-helix domain-containing protein [Sutcliffiella horikoshii]
MLGDRIRKLRKQKKMTLEAVAGSELTKGMLSLIENNKANPSMESLTYIARQLGVEKGDLLGEVSSEELRETLERAEKIFNIPFRNQDSLDKYKRLIELIKPHIGKLSNGYESARLMEIYSYALQNEKKQGWESLLDIAADMFDQMNISSNRTAIGIFRSNIAFFEHNYQEALKILMAERNEIEAKHAYIEPMARLDLDYSEAILLYAVGNSEAAIETMEKALAYSKDKRIFYLIDDLYRLAAAHALMEGNKKEKDYYLLKLKQYGEFADHISSIYFCELFEIIELISENQEYTKALEKVEVCLSSGDLMDFYTPWFILEKAKALYYLGMFEEALQSIEKVVIPDIHHPIDLSNFYLKESYQALILMELGRTEEAVTAAQKAVENLEPFLDSKMKDFSREVLKQVSG